jgi:glycosyltransferase involved in cell wall biosynthesis/GT2 family glycosyltransferase/SAM-dependent methyltransferase
VPEGTEFITLDFCPWCQSTLIIKIATRGDGLPVMRCANCHLAFLGEVPTDLSVFYDNEYFTRNQLPTPDIADTGYQNYDRSYGPCSFRWLSMVIRATIGPESRELFDLGAATGTFMEAAIFDGFAVSGSELHEGAAARARQKGLNVVGGPFDPNDWDRGSFDVVTALEVLEHVLDVRSTVLDLVSLLKPDGWLVFFVPILSDAALAEHGDLALDLLAHYEHTLYFNPSFLQTMSDELFGPRRLALWTVEVEERGQRISYALGFIRPSGEVSSHERRLLDLLAEDTEDLTRSSAYDALAIALSSAKMGRFDRAQAALDVARDSEDQAPLWQVANAQILRQKGELHAAIEVLEDAIVTDVLGHDPMAPSLLIETIEDLLTLLKVESEGMARGLIEVHARLDQAQGAALSEDQSAALQRQARSLQEENDRQRQRIEVLEATADKTRRAMEGLGHELSLEKATITELHNRLDLETASLEQENTALSADLSAIYDSRSWKLISRLRAAAALPSKLFKRAEPAAVEPEVVEATPEMTEPWAPRLWSPSAGDARYLVSVIMPVYNKGAAIRSSLESVWNQTLTPVEVVLWDDGSTDTATQEVLAEVRRGSDVTLFHADNQGVVAARNNAISMSRGKYVCCLDPDDEIAPTYLEQAVAFLETHPDYSIAYPWVDTIGYMLEVWRTTDLDPRGILEGNHVPVCAVFAREVFEATGGFSEDMTHGYEDWEFWAHAAELGFKGKAIPARLFRYLYSADAAESRDAGARELHEELNAEIASLHPRLALTGLPQYRAAPTRVRPVGRELGPRRLPPGQGRPVVAMIPWYTVGGADSVISALMRRWVDQGRTIVVFMTTHLEPSMPDRSDDLRLLTPYVYNLWDFLPLKQWYDFVASTIGALESPLIFNMGSGWFFESVRAFSRDFPDARIVDQQFNAIGHLGWNRDLADVIDLTIAAYHGLAEEIEADGRSSEVATLYVGIDEPQPPGRDETDKFRRHAGIGANERIVLYVGRLSVEKRPEWAIELAGELQDAHTRVVMVGDGPLGDEVAAAIESDHGPTWIREVEDIESAIAAASLLVLPSAIEGIPLVALESLALGTPIVATRVGGMPDLEAEEGVTLIDPDDFGAFVEAVQKALDTDFGQIKLPERFRSDEMLDHYDRLLFPEDEDTDF